MTAAILETAHIVDCPECGAPTIGRFTADQRYVTLDAELVPAGLFTLDEHNRAVRRPLSDYVRESAGHGGPGGLAEHICTGRPSWLDA